MKGQITELKKIIDENEVVRGYLIVVEVIEVPDLKLGECEIFNIKKLK